MELGLPIFEQVMMQRGETDKGDHGDANNGHTNHNQ